MSTIVFPCNGQEVLIKRKPTPRAKRLSLRLTPRDHAFVLTVPARTTESRIKAFLTHCTPWIEKTLKKVAPITPLIPDTEVVLHGTPFQCLPDPLRRKPSLCKNTQTLFLPPQCSQDIFHDFLKKMAKDTLMPYVLEAGRTLGQRIEKVTFRDTKSRWGSCSSGKRISLSWRLILAPPEVAEYVCIHEAVHLLHMNHSKAFWKTVEALCPAYKSHKKWLKTHGLSLMTV